MITLFVGTARSAERYAREWKAPVMRDIVPIALAQRRLAGVHEYVKMVFDPSYEVSDKERALISYVDAMNRMWKESE